MVKDNDVVRLEVETTDIFTERTVPAGTEGTVIYVKGEECLVEVTFREQTEEDDGDFGQVAVLPGQYEVIHDRGRT